MLDFNADYVVIPNMQKSLSSIWLFFEYEFVLQWNVNFLAFFLSNSNFSFPLNKKPTEFELYRVLGFLTSPK